MSHRAINHNTKGSANYKVRKLMKNSKIQGTFSFYLEVTVIKAMST